MAKSGGAGRQTPACNFVLCLPAAPSERHVFEALLRWRPCGYQVGAEGERVRA